MKILKIMGKEIPNYHSIKISNISLNNYLGALFIYSRIAIGSKRYLWGCIRVFQQSLIRLGSFLRKYGLKN